MVGWQNGDEYLQIFDGRNSGAVMPFLRLWMKLLYVICYLGGYRIFYLLILTPKLVYGAVLLITVRYFNSFTAAVIVRAV